MIKINERQVNVNTPNGIGVLEDIIITSLGYIQLRVKFEDGEFSNYMKFTVSSLNELLSNSELHIIDKELVENE